MRRSGGDSWPERRQLLHWREIEGEGADGEAGISAGREEERLSLAKMMLEENEPMDKIVKYTGYEIDRIRKIAEQVNR